MPEIPQLQIPQMGAVSGGADFSGLAQLPEIYRQRQAQQVLSQLQRKPDGTFDTAPLFASGDMKLAALGMQLEHSQALARQDTRDYAFRERQQSATEQYHKDVLAKGDIPSGYRRSATGELEYIPGGPADPVVLRQRGDRQHAPTGYTWKDPADPTKGVDVIPGGPAEKVDAEVAGRLGLAKSFLGQLPALRKQIEEGGVSGPISTAQAMAGTGKPGEIRRKIDSGAEALLRMLTGAGMNKDEATEYVRRYKFSPLTDIWSGDTLISKLDQLERELNSVGETVGKGRGGWTPPKPDAPAAPAVAAPGKTKTGVTWSVE